VIDRCLAKDPAHRYPDLANLAHALAAYAGPDGWELANMVSRMVHSMPIAQAAPAIGDVAPTVPPTSYVDSAPTTLGSTARSLQVEQPRNGHRWGVIAGIAAAVVATLVTYFVLDHGSRREPTPTPIVQPTPPIPEPPAAPDAAGARSTPEGSAESIDAAEPVVVPADAAEPAVAPPDAAPILKKKPPKKPPTKQPEDFGESRI
jgi:hypothetical protein